MTNPLNALPPGFLQSEYGPAYQSVLQQYNAGKDAYAADPNMYADNPAYENASLGAPVDPGGLGAWLKNAPIQFSAGRSLADWAKPTTAGQIAGMDPADIGMMALGGFGSAAMGAGVGMEGGVGAVGELPYASDPLAGVPPTDAGPLTYAQEAGTTASDVTPSQINQADFSNINNPGAPAPETSSPLQASQDPLGSAGDPGLSSSRPLSLQEEQAQYYKNMNDANAAKNAPGMSTGDFFKGMGNDPLGTLGKMPLGSSALTAATLVNMIGSYQARKKQQQQQAAAVQAQAERQHQINVNPNTGGANPIPNSRTQYLGTPNFNPFISQGPQDRLAFGPSPWQLGAPGQPPGGQARGGLAGMNMRDPAQGALSLARGPGGGQDDKIPALLSDGEYVMDAGAVADLGDGSTKEGARRLDKLRQNLRMHKRAAPAASIPPKAKSPASYLRGKA